MFLDGTNTAGGFDIWHFVETLFGTGAVVLIYVLTVRREDKKEQQTKHEENQKTMSDIRGGQKEIEKMMEILPLHGHTERSGPLTAEGIYIPNGRKR